MGVAKVATPILLVLNGQPDRPGPTSASEYTAFFGKVTLKDGKRIGAGGTLALALIIHLFGRAHRSQITDKSSNPFPIPVLLIDLQPGGRK